MSELLVCMKFMACCQTLLILTSDGSVEESLCICFFVTARCDHLHPTTLVSGVVSFRVICPLKTILVTPNDSKGRKTANHPKYASYAYLRFVKTNLLLKGRCGRKYARNQL